jgi:hypothetical protein
MLRRNFRDVRRGTGSGKVSSNERSNAMELVLYHQWHCPYSRQVRDYIEAGRPRGEIEYRDIDEDAPRRGYG